jgi:hypothetical protein
MIRTWGRKTWRHFLAGAIKILWSNGLDAYSIEKFNEPYLYPA